MPLRELVSRAAIPAPKNAEELLWRLGRDLTRLFTEYNFL